MRLIWKLPDSDGGERIKTYFIEKKSLTDKAWTTVNITNLSKSIFIRTEVT